MPCRLEEKDVAVPVAHAVLSMALAVLASHRAHEPVEHMCQRV